MNESRNRLPIEPIDRVTFPFKRFFRIEAAAGGVLLVFTLCAVIASNSPWSAVFAAFWDLSVGFQLGAFEFSRSIKHWINDALMTLFFFIVALELKRELVLGELRNPRMAALSFSAALGGMIAPAALYLFLTVRGGGVGIHGWGTVMATDTAFVIGCMAILGDRIPVSLRLFLLSLAIFDDVGAILVIAIGYGSPLNWSALACAAIGLVVSQTMTRLGVRGLPAYFAIGGLIWLAVDRSGVHPTVVGVVLGLMTPARSWISDRRLHAILKRVAAYPPGDHWSGNTEDQQELHQARTATREVLSPVERLEILLHPWVAFLILPLFALANAGVSITGADFHATLAAAVFVGLVLGKPLGVFVFSYLAVQIGLAVRPPTVSWTLLAAGGLLTGIGFTMALFISELAFDPDLLNSAKLGIFGASIVAGVAGLLTLTWLTRRAGA